MFEVNGELVVMSKVRLACSGDVARDGDVGWSVEERSTGRMDETG